MTSAEVAIICPDVLVDDAPFLNYLESGQPQSTSKFKNPQVVKEFGTS